MRVCIYIYIYLSMFDLIIKARFVYITLKSFKVSDKCLGFKFELVQKFNKIFPSAFEPFKGPHQGLLACVKSVFEF